MDLERRSGKELNTEKSKLRGRIFSYKNLITVPPILTYLVEIYSKALSWFSHQHSKCSDILTSTEKCK
jgi:hypothetical protein